MTDMTVDVWALAYKSAEVPEERAVLLLASAMNDTGPKRVAVPWDLQVAAADYLNTHGLARTLDEIVRLVGAEGLE